MSDHAETAANEAKGAKVTVDASALAALYETCSAAAESATDPEGVAESVLQARSPGRAALRTAREEATELGGQAPDALSASLLRLLAHNGAATSAVYIGEAPGVVALALLDGMAPGGTVTAITSDPHHAQAGKNALAAAKLPANACRFISTRPLEVLGKLASGSYDLVVAQAGALAPELLARRGLELVGDGCVVVLGAVDYFDEQLGAGALPADVRVQAFPLGTGVTVLSVHQGSAGK